MQIALTKQQQQDREAFNAFVDAEVAPQAGLFDQQEQTPPELVRKLGQQGYLGAVIPREKGGSGLDMITFGLLNEALGRGCSSVRSLLTVHSMAGYAIQKWGSRAQQAHYLPRLAAGELIGAFALTEPEAGSDAKSIGTRAVPHEDGYLVSGTKRWITYGEIADLYLLFAQSEGQPVALLVERESPGLTVTPIRGMLGVRGSMLAELRLEQCYVPQANVVGKPGFGLSHVLSAALDVGRYSVAWGCVGIAQACLEQSVAYTGQRKQYGTYLKEHQLIQQMLTNMVTQVQAARLLCYRAGYLKDIKDPGAIMETWVAKYYASTAAVQIAGDAVQIHGARGCSEDYPVNRYLRDAKIMEIIEGSTQIQQINIAAHAAHFATTATR